MNWGGEESSGLELLDGTGPVEMNHPLVNFGRSWRVKWEPGPGHWPVWPMGRKLWPEKSVSVLALGGTRQLRTGGVPALHHPWPGSLMDLISNRCNKHWQSLLHSRPGMAQPEVTGTLSP